MIDQSKNLIIGLFVIAACAIITFIILFLHPSVGDEGRVLRVRFSNVDKINIGTRVTFAGKPVGEVVEITEIPAAITQRKGHNGLVYIYELKLAVDSKVNAYNTDDVYARTSGLLGEKSVEISPRPQTSREVLRNINDEIIYAKESPSVEETLNQFTEVGNKFDMTMSAIMGMMQEVQKQQMLQKMGQMMENASMLMTRINSKWPTIENTLNNVAGMTHNFNEFSAKMNDSNGTLSKLLFNEDLFLRTTSIMSKAETLMDDINHYGVLFHLDKGWQRLRSRRMNLMQQLCTPQEFRNFFNDEINQISTSLTRVYMILDKNSCCPPYSSSICDTEFTKVYAELIRRVEGLEEILKMYNQQLVDREVKQTELCECR